MRLKNLNISNLCKVFIFSINMYWHVASMITKFLTSQILFCEVLTDALVRQLILSCVHVVTLFPIFRNFAMHAAYGID